MSGLAWIDRTSCVLTMLLRYGPLTIGTLADLSGLSYARTWNIIHELSVDGRYIDSWGPRGAIQCDIKGRGARRP